MRKRPREWIVRSVMRFIIGADLHSDSFAARNLVIRGDEYLFHYFFLPPCLDGCRYDLRLREPSPSNQLGTRCQHEEQCRPSRYAGALFGNRCGRRILWVSAGADAPGTPASRPVAPGRGAYQRSSFVTISQKLLAETGSKSLCALCKRSRPWSESALLHPNRQLLRTPCHDETGDQ